VVCLGIKLTASLHRYLWLFHRNEYALVWAFGHTELLEEWWDDYLRWCDTDEGRSYLRGGENYREAY